ncbi:MAG: hypothetical protein ACFFE4_08130 [Candidatus Thorarchaeota archaeon]
MEWRDILDNLYLWYNEFINWYVAQPIYGQILSIIGIIALLALIITLIYYIIKGIAYLIYYILKGIYYLLKGIGLLFYKLSKGFYKLISGEKKPNIQIEKEEFPNKEIYNNRIMYCSECGKRMSGRMINHLLSQNIAYCDNCGKGQRLIHYKESSILPS